MKYEVRYTIIEKFTDRKLAEKLCYKAACEQVERRAGQGRGMTSKLQAYGGPAKAIGYGVCPTECSSKMEWPRILVFEND